MIDVEIDFFREYGERQVVTAQDNGDVTIISQPDWDGMRESMHRLSNTQVGQAILTPELITIADAGRGDLWVYQTMVADRLAEAKEWTRSLPDAIMLLGSVVFHDSGTRPSNVVQLLQNGQEIGRTHKRFPLGKHEIATFDTNEMHADVPVEGTTSIICSDILAPQRINTRTALVSACWSTPVGYPGVAKSPDHRHLRFLEYAAGQLFELNPALETVVMADRVPQMSVSTRPFNFSAYRLGNLTEVNYSRD